ncbi:MAG TPA: preprotein translocase subunit SecE [Gemmatimonadaceae bacterium]|jgi:preprotein translocase subunit SecE|nr:preprotein translocase subunit SecE [Gemmatimonadaceae bacterium]
MPDAVAGSGGTPPVVRPNWWSRLVAFYHGVMAEMRKVTWPDLPQVRSATISIIIFVMLIGLVITLLDFILQGVLIKMIPSLFAGR